MVHFNPSETAAAALCLSQLVLDGQKWVICLNVRIFLYLSRLHQFIHLLIPPVQSPTQQHYSSYDEAHLKLVMQHIAKNVVMVNEGLSKHVVSSLLYLCMGIWFY